MDDCNSLDSVSGSLHWLTYISHRIDGDYMEISVKTKSQLHKFCALSVKYLDNPIWMHFASMDLYFPTKFGMMRLCVDKKVDDTYLTNQILKLQRFFKTWSPKLKEKNKMNDHILRCSLSKVNHDTLSVITAFLRSPLIHPDKHSCFSQKEMCSLQYDFLGPCSDTKTFIEQSKANTKSDNFV